MSALDLEKLLIAFYLVKQKIRTFLPKVDEFG